MKTVDELPRRQTRGLGEDLEALVEIAVEQGARSVIAVDLTHEDLGVPVAKVIVPGFATDVEAMG